MILNGDLEAGSQHSIYKLAERLKVSRTPVREAVLRLADVGLLAIERNRGVRIRGITTEDVREVFELRLLLEVPMAAAAARLADDDVANALSDGLDLMQDLARNGHEAAYVAADREFHRLIAAALSNQRLAAEVDRLRDSIQLRNMTTYGRSRDLDDVAAEHAPIVAAIVAGDPQGAGVAMADHLERTGTLLMGQFAAESETVDPDWARAIRAELHP